MHRWMIDGSAEQGGEEQGRQNLTRVFCLGPAALLIPELLYSEGIMNSAFTKFVCGYKLIEQCRR